MIHCRPPTQRAADRIARTSSSDAWAPLRDDSEGPGIEHVGPQTCGDSATGATGAAFAGMVRHSFFCSHFGEMRKVKSQLIGIDQTSFLCNMLS